MCLRMEDMMPWANDEEDSLSSILDKITNYRTESVVDVAANKMAAEIESFAYDEFSSLDEAPDENETEEMDDDEGDDEILEDDDDVLHGEDPPAAALPSSLTDLLNVANHDRILEAA